MRTTQSEFAVQYITTQTVPGEVAKEDGGEGNSGHPQEFAVDHCVVSFVRRFISPSKLGVGIEAATKSLRHYAVHPDLKVEQHGPQDGVGKRWTD